MADEVVRPKRLHELTAQEVPPFTPGTVEWVRWSVGQLPSGNERILTDTFYEELFIMAPSARALFDTDMDPQKDRLLHALLSAAKYMDRPDKVEGHLRTWGIIHRRQYGVTDDMYLYVGGALVRTINRILGNDQTRIHSSWVAVYQWMAAVMIAAADDVDQLRQDPAAQQATIIMPPVVNLEYERGERSLDNVVVPMGRKGKRRRRA